MHNLFYQQGETPNLLTPPDVTKILSGPGTTVKLVILAASIFNVLVKTGAV